MQWKPYDINLDEGFTVMKAQENQQKQTKKERESASHAHIHSHSHTRIYAELQFDGRLQWRHWRE